MNKKPVRMCCTVIKAKNSIYIWYIYSIYYMYTIYDIYIM